MSNFSTKRNLQPSFLTEHPKSLGIRSREIWHKPKIFESHSRSFMGKLCACWCCHMEPRGRSRSSWNLHALVWKTTRTLGYLNRMINSTAVRGHLQLYNTGRESGFPRIQPGVDHSDCCVYLLNALVWPPRKLLRPQTRKSAATPLLSSFYCLRTLWVNILNLLNLSPSNLQSSFYFHNEMLNLFIFLICSLVCEHTCCMVSFIPQPSFIEVSLVEQRKKYLKCAMW